MNIKHTIDLSPREGVVCKTEHGDISIRILQIGEDGEVMIGIEGSADLTVYTGDGKERALSGVPKCKGLLRLWLLFSLILSIKTRRDIFLPAFNEFLEDYVFARKRYRTKWARRWIAFAFSVRTVGMIADCLRIQVCSVFSLFAHSFATTLARWLSRLTEGGK